MPRPALLPIIDWQTVLNDGSDWKKWLEIAESDAQRDKMKEKFASLELSKEDKSRLAGLKKNVSVVAIAEDWCGDVVRHAPVLAKIAEESDKVTLRFISREYDLGLFARYLTNGGEAIPKFVFLSEALVECGNWGPMQADCRGLIAKGKGCGDVKAARKLVSEIYEADGNCRTVFKELIDLIKTAGSEAVQ